MKLILVPSKYIFTQIKEIILKESLQLQFKTSTMDKGMVQPRIMKLIKELINITIITGMKVLIIELNMQRLSIIS